MAFTARTSRPSACPAVRPRSCGGPVLLALATAAGIASSIAPAGLRAQEARTVPAPMAVEILPRPYADPAASAVTLREMLRAQPGRRDLQVALVRELTAVGVIADAPEERIAALEEAAELAFEMIEADSTAVDGHHWYAVARGLHSDQVGGREKIERAREAHVHTLIALDIDPDHPGANHVMGRLHAGTLRLSFVTRMIGRMLGLGEIMDEATWEGSERHMRIAAEGEPDMLVYQLELGRLLVRTGQEEEGWAIIESLASRTPRHRLDAYYVLAAREEVEERS